MCLGRRRDLIAGGIALHIAVFPRPLLQPDLRPPPEHSKRRSKAEPVPHLIPLPIRQCTLLSPRSAPAARSAFPLGAKQARVLPGALAKSNPTQQTAAAWTEDLGQRAP